MSVPLSAEQAVEISIKEKLTIAELLEMGFTINTAGNANTEAAAAKPKVEVKPELVAHAEALFNAGVSRGKTKNTGRPRTTLGTKQGSYPYNVSVSIDPAYEG